MEQQLETTERIGERVDCLGIRSWFEHRPRVGLCACAEIACPEVPGPENVLKVCYVVGQQPERVTTVTVGGLDMSFDDHTMLKAKAGIHRALKLLRTEGLAALRKAQALSPF